MKKALLGLFAAALFTTVMGASIQPAAAFAADVKLARNFIDADGDGVCDNYPAGQGRGCGRNYVDVDGDGVCDNYLAGQGRGCGRNYVDADGDGVCDNYLAGQGRGCGNGARGGRNK